MNTEMGAVTPTVSLVGIKAFGALELRAHPVWVLEVRVSPFMVYFSRMIFNFSLSPADPAILCLGMY